MPMIKRSDGSTQPHNEYYVGPQGEFRWKSNDAVIPPWCWDDKSNISKLEMPPMPENHLKVYEEETSRSIADYKRQMGNYVMSDEERMELTAVHGEGAVIVNALTGKKTRL